MPEQKLIDDCVHCGFCLPGCPTYQSWGQEADSPRGRIFLMKALNDKKLPIAQDTRVHFDRCLGCMACVTNCPSGVKYDALIEQTRAEVEHALPREGFDKWHREMIFSLFPYPRRLKLAMVFQLLYQKLGLQWLVRKLGIMKLFPLRIRQMESLMPKASPSMLAAPSSAHVPAQGEKRARVALLLGCVQRIYFPNVNAATLRVLSAEGCEVIAPEGLQCCGALSLHAGREEEAQAFARAAIDAIEKENVDAIIVNSAGCGSSMKDWGRVLQHDPAYAGRAAAAAKKVKDISEFLAALPARATRHPLPMKAAYHDACHLGHAQKIRAQPRALLAAIPELRVSDIPDGDQCCGSAGIYNLVQPESANEIGLRKLGNVLSVNPEVLVSANPGCTLHLSALLRESGKTIRAAHPIELIDASIRGVPL